MWKKNVVKLGGKKVFHINEHGEYVFEHEAARVKEKVQTLVQQWLDVRQTGALGCRTGVHNVPKPSVYL